MVRTAGSVRRSNLAALLNGPSTFDFAILIVLDLSLPGRVYPDIPLSRKNARGVGCFNDSKPPKSVDGYHYSVAAF